MTAIAIISIFQEMALFPALVTETRSGSRPSDCAETGFRSAEMIDHGSLAFRLTKGVVSQTEIKTILV